MLDEALINVSTLWRVADCFIHAYLEESLSNTLVDNDQSFIWKFAFVSILVFHRDNLVELLKLVTDDLSSHGISNTISVNEDVIWEGTIVVVFKCFESLLEVLLEHARADDLLALLALGTRLGVVLAHVLVVGSTEADNTLFTFVANIDSNEHGFFGDLWSETKAPEVTTELSINLSEDVDVDPVVVLLNSLTGDKLGDNWTISIDLVLKSSVQMLLFDGVWHNN